MDVLVLYVQYAALQEPALFVIALIAFAALVVVLRNVINAFALHAAVQLIYVIHAAIFAIVHHVNAIFQHALHALTPVSIFANYETNI